MTGAQYDIIAVGAMDKSSLTGNPTTTFWKGTYKQHTRFAIESMSQPMNTAIAYGQSSQCMLNRVGDMIYYLYLHVTLPGIVACDSKADGASCAGITGTQFPTFMDNGGACAPCAKMDEAALLEYLPGDYNDLSPANQAAALKEAKDIWRREKYGAGRELGCCSEGDADCPDKVCPELGDTWAHFCNDVGHFLVSKCTLVIGGQEVDKLWSTFLFVWEELTGRSGRRLTELCGRRYTRAQLVCDSREERDLYVPLPFWFTLNSGSALCLAALAYHGVQINIDFERLEKLIVVSGSHVAVRHAKTGLALTPNDLKCEMEVTHVFLDQEERDQFSSRTYEQLIVQTQHYFRTDSKAVCSIPLTFNHPTLELIFGVRRQCHERSNGWGNLSGVDGRDPITHAELLLNTTSRFGKKPALYWRGVVPFERHRNIPEAYIYVMSFALTPEDSQQPSGSLNLSRIDNVELVLDMQSALANESYTVFVFARSFNLLRFGSGTAGVKYA
jgi:hypothetical protein